MNNDDHERRVAVLIDAENIAPKYLPIVLSEANNLGSVNIKRIYGDWTMPQMSSWRTVILVFQCLGQKLFGLGTHHRRNGPSVPGPL